MVLDHQPFDLNTPAREGAALQISGHTHNGPDLADELVHIDYFSTTPPVIPGLGVLNL